MIESSSSSPTKTMKKAVQFGIVEHVEAIEVVERWNDGADTDPSPMQLWWTRNEVREIEEESETLLHFMNRFSSSGASICSSSSSSSSSSNNTNSNCIPPPPPPDEIINGTNHSMRGLEKRTELGAWDVYETQRDARNAVLNQQDKNQKVLSLQQRSKSPVKKRTTSGISSSSSSISFDLQKQQMQQLHDMQEAIAMVYRVATLNARRAAFEIGLQDQFDAQDCYNNSSDSDSDSHTEITAMIKNSQPIAAVVPAVQQESSRVVVTTSEPMSRGNRSFRRISMPLIDLSVATTNDSSVDDNGETNNHHGDSGNNEDALSLPLNTDRSNLARPRLRIGITPMKKRRPTLVKEESSSTDVLAPSNTSTKTGYNDSNTTNDSAVLVKRNSSSRRKKLDELLNNLIVRTGSLLDDTTNKESLLLTAATTTTAPPERRKKKTIKKRIDDLDGHVLQQLQEKNAVALTTKATKKTKKKKSSLASKIGTTSTCSSGIDNQRKSPKRTMSRDSSKGNCTTDTEIITESFDHNSMSSFDDSFAETGICHNNNNNKNHHSYGSDFMVVKSATTNTVLLQDSFITL